jgi:hypothetical protein
MKKWIKEEQRVCQKQSILEECILKERINIQQVIVYYFMEIKENIIHEISDKINTGP